ncbi:MAG: hypothetical protein ACKVT0_08910, partial [Planctomycetaceae bacterium]
MHSRNQFNARSTSAKKSPSATGGVARNAAIQSSKRAATRPSAAFHRRGQANNSSPFNAPEVWHEPTESGRLDYIVHEPGTGYCHPVTVEEIQQRIDLLPSRFVEDLEVV